MAGRAVQPGARRRRRRTAARRAVRRASAVTPANRAAPSGPRSRDQRDRACGRRERRRASSPGSPRMPRASARRTSRHALAVAGVNRVEARGRPRRGRGTAPPRDRRQRVRVAGLRMRPAQAVALERHPREHRRGRAGRVHGRERVVPESRQRQLLGAHGAAWAIGGLEHGHRVAGLGKPDRGGEPVRAGADHDGTHDRGRGRGGAGA